MPHPDLDRLLDFCLRFAQNRLTRNGAFHPFAAGIGATGEVQPLAIHLGDEIPGSQELIGQYTARLKELAAAGELQAGALCHNTVLESDAVTVMLEHANGECVTVFLPYRKEPAGSYHYDPMIAITAERRFFASTA